MIFATPSRDAGSCLGIMFVASKPVLEEQVRESKRVRLETLLTLGFSEEDKVRTFQPHDDALVVTLCVGGMM